MTQELVLFFSQPIFVVVSGVSTILVILTIISSIVLTMKGLTPVLYRLGMGLSRRNIAIFALDTEYRSLRDMLIDSGVFVEKNIKQISRGDINKAKKYNLFLVQWDEYKEVINDILNIKDDSASLVVYAPQRNMLPQEMDAINSHRNSIVVNFKGRLLNDILVSLMTTSFNKK